MTRDEVANLIGSFTWDFGNKFFIETEKGNFEWSDPDYGGDNTIRDMKCSYRKWSGGIAHMLRKWCDYKKP